MKNLFFYIKNTKECNLRCRYCYEQEYFNDHSRLTLSNIELILNKAKKYCLRHKIERVRFGYAGGEVLILGKDYLESMFKLTKQTFRGTGIKLEVEIQTNLTLMNQEFIDIIKKYNVYVGVSFDVVGGQRRFANKRPADPVIIDKLILLLKNKISFSGIVVVNKMNYRRAGEIFNLYKKIYTNFHTLCIHPWASKFCPELELSDSECIIFLKQLADKYLEQKEPKIQIDDIDAYIRLLTKGRRGEILCIFTGDCQGNNLFIEPNGDVFPCFNLQVTKFRYGNILEDSIEHILNSPVLRRLKERRKLILNKCKGCRYLEICNGGCMARAYWEGNIFAPSKSSCFVNRAMFQYLEEKLKQRGLKTVVS